MKSLTPCAVGQEEMTNDPVAEKEQTELITATTQKFDHTETSCLQRSRHARDGLYTDEKDSSREDIGWDNGGQSQMMKYVITFQRCQA